MKVLWRSALILLSAVLTACGAAASPPSIQRSPATAVPTAASPQAPTPSPCPALSPAEILGVTPSPPSTDTVLLARQDGSVVLRNLAGEGERVLLGPGLYDVSGDAFLTMVGWPVRLSPDGAWLLVPTPEDGTWLVSVDSETRRQVTAERLTATWAPDSRRIVFRGELGPQPRERDDEIYVWDVIDEDKPRLLARLPNEVHYPTWSPGCGDPGTTQIAAFSGETYTHTVWLLDADSGKNRSLGQFLPEPTMGVPGMIRWSPECDELWIDAQFGALAFPVDGSGPRPLVTALSNLSPDGTLRAAAERIRGEDGARLVVSRVRSGASVTYDATFEQVADVLWTADGRRVLVNSYTGEGYELWAADPAVGQPALVAEHVAFLGTLHTLRHNSTEVGRHRTSLRTLPPPGSPSTWVVQSLPDLGLRLRVPEAWRFEVQDVGASQMATLANFEVEGAQGSAPLEDDQLEVTFVRLQRPPTEDFTTWLSQIVEMEQHQVTAKPITVAGRQGARVRPIVSPVSEDVRVPLGGQDLRIYRRPISSTQDAVFEQLLGTVTIIE